MPYYRKITVDGIEYEYHVDRSKVKVKPFGAVRMNKFTGLSWDELEDYPPPITPKDIEDFIREQLKTYVDIDAYVKKQRQKAK